MWTQRATVKRPTAGAEDRYGNAQYTLETAASSVPCRVVERRRRRLDPNSGEWAWTLETVGYFGGGAGVQRGDVVEVDGRAYRVADVRLARDAWGAGRVLIAQMEALA